jgi:sec-independent protein translocase protein TatA
LARALESLYCGVIKNGSPAAPAGKRSFVMGSMSPIHWLIVAVVVLLLFGGSGKLSSIMGDAAKGVKAFKDGLKDENIVEKTGSALPRKDAEKEEPRKS